MRNIIIIEAVSTGYNLVEDAVRRGYRPVVMELPGDSKEIDEYRHKFYRILYHKPEIIKASYEYEETLSMVKKYDPLIIVPGFEGAVELATRLSEDLGLIGNPYSNIAAMTRKDAMHEALKNAGLRYIKGKTVTTADEAEAFCKENGLQTAVVKPVRSASSQGLFLCDNTDEVKNAVNTLLNSIDIFGKPITRVLIQERITGTEYVVNTASSNGLHKVNSITRYHKTRTSEGGYIYDWEENVMVLEDEHRKLVDYALKVADAIGFKYGVIHGEYYIDDKGPILVEVNCRPMGGSMPAEFLDMAFGQHETDTMLDAYLDSEAFRKSMNKPYQPLRKYALKMIKVPRLLEVDDYTIKIIADQLKSTYITQISDTILPVIYEKTQDLDSSGGTIYLMGDDEDQVMKDLELLKYIEDNYFHFVFNDGMSRRWLKNENVPDNDIDVIASDFDCHGAVLAACEDAQEKPGMMVVTPDTLIGAHKGFDYVILGYSHSFLGLREAQCLKLIFDTIDKVKPGGTVIIPDNTYEYLTYKEEGAKLLLKIKGLEADTVEISGRKYVVGVSGR